jgi:hypothetical protein
MHCINHQLLIHFSKWLSLNKDILYKLQCLSPGGFSTKTKEMFVEHIPVGLNNLEVLFSPVKIQMGVNANFRTRGTSGPSMTQD